MISRREHTLLGIGWLLVLLGWATQLPTTHVWGSITAAGVLLWQWWWLWQQRTLNQHPQHGTRYTTLGLANHVSLLRLLSLALLSSLIGFAPLSDRWAWVAGVLALTNAILDYVDGYVARRTQTLSRLGQELDGNLDALGVVVCVVAGLQWQRIGWWYLAAAAARYCFQLGLWWRKRANLPVASLPPGDTRRAQAGIQFMVLSCSLLPIFPSQATYWASLAFALPFLLAFARDWGIVSTLLPPNTNLQPANFLALSYRALVFGLGCWYAWQMYPQWGLGVAGLFLPLLAMAAGWATRAVAIGCVIALGILGNHTLHASSYLPLLLATIGAIYVGSGTPALWQPETQIMAHRAGSAVAR